MSKVLIVAAMLVTGPVFAQTPASPPPAPQTGSAPAQPMTPSPEFMTAAQAFGQCLGGKIGASPATVAPEAASRQALAGCATQKATLQTTFETWVAGPTFPPAGRTEARAQFKAQMDGLETQIASQIRETRTQAAPAAPAPAATPTPAPAR